jgi:hypothetical protein
MIEPAVRRVVVGIVAAGLLVRHRPFLPDEVGANGAGKSSVLRVIAGLSCWAAAGSRRSTPRARTGSAPAGAPPAGGPGPARRRGVRCRDSAGGSSRRAVEH